MKKKKLFTLIFCILALVIIMLFLWNSKILENKKNTASIATKEECVKANVNEYMDLNKFLKSVKLEETYGDGSIKEYTLADCNVDFNKYSWITIKEDKICINKYGVHKLKVEKNGLHTEVLIVSKNKSDTEYVLYKENFNNVKNGNIPDAWNRYEGTKIYDAYVENGELILDALSDNKTKRVILPDYLFNFSNYSITADVTIDRCLNETRWGALMFRIQNSGVNHYFQMAIRRQTTANNGVELAEKINNDEWNVIDSDAYLYPISGTQTYKIQLKAYNNCIQEYINNKLIINYNNAATYSSGGIGIQANGCRMKIDNIKIVLQEEKLSKKESDKYVNVHEITKKISIAPTSCIYLNNKDDIDILNKDLIPANLIINLNDNLKVINGENQEIYNLDELFYNLHKKIIPVFNISNMNIAKKLVLYLQKKEIADVTVMSDNPEIIKYIREKYPIVRGILKFNDKSKLSNDRLKEIFMKANECNAKIIFIPNNLIDYDVVKYFQSRLLTVWSNSNGTNDNKKEIYRLISTGINGIITDDFNSLVECYKKYSKNTLVRTPAIIGHRGLPSKAPENTLDSAVLAYKNGATVIEDDIYLTKDNKIVILHDGTLSRTTNGTGFIEDYTLEELKKLDANKQFINTYPKEEIPTLEEYLKKFKGKNVIHFIEIKSEKLEIVDELNALINKIGVQDQVVIISFNKSQLQRVNKIMPWASVGILSRICATSDIGQSLYYIFGTTQNVNSTFNPSYSCMRSATLEELNHRGMTVWPWTYNNYTDFKKHYKMGIYGLTTNFANWTKDIPTRIEPFNDSYSISIGEEIQLKAGTITYGREFKYVNVDVIPVENEEIIKADGNKVVPLKEGKALILLRTKVKFKNVSGEKNNYKKDYFYLYSSPIELNITK